MWIVESRREGLGLMQSRQGTPIAARWHDRRTQGEAEVDGLLTCLTRLRQMLESAERLLEAPHGLTMRRALKGALPGPLPIG